MFERLTGRARHVLALARDEADAAGEENVGTEHLLLAILREGACVPAKLLKHLEITFDQVRKAVGQCASVTASPTVRLHDSLFSPRAAKALQLAAAKADLGSHRKVAVQALGILQVDMPQVRKNIVDLITAPLP